MMKKLITACLLTATLFTGYTAYAQQRAGNTIREGKHSFTLQWISWDHPGEVMIEKQKDATYTVKGEQRDEKTGDFVTIDGTLTVDSPKELTFNGTIRTQYSNVNGGKVCEKTGTYHFLAKGARKYWRLQEMDNCEGNNVVDYVDIYFH
ncbi:hypothetical protein HF324_12895 [Chitinophaga oryzae]|uniref:Lipocalin-like domain-containing protein n=1 Tax=Chitinophaga oryzae TaxID=2725414 RepID=A0AAE6ZIX9_9BACT|nr:hypothetical protein [Chitinophaga oryzae]QJB32254.1 hypothetical protein HF329_13325 [Chitinophaga oryzae]QJB38715.1 hypothetical protein HF324_12895 [Chitinophaga oryzae]